jgi:hypothetical protein
MLARSTPLGLQPPDFCMHACHVLVAPARVFCGECVKRRGLQQRRTRAVSAGSEGGPQARPSARLSRPIRPRKPPCFSLLKRKSEAANIARSWQEFSRWSRTDHWSRDTTRENGHAADNAVLRRKAVEIIAATWELWQAKARINERLRWGGGVGACKQGAPCSWTCMCALHACMRGHRCVHAGCGRLILISTSSRWSSTAAI